MESKNEGVDAKRSPSFSGLQLPVHIILSKFDHLRCARDQLVHLIGNMKSKKFASPSLSLYPNQKPDLPFSRLLPPDKAEEHSAIDLRI